MGDTVNSQGTSGRGHAVVIGAGIVGLCCGTYLQRDGWQVTWIDPRGPGEGCSYGNAGQRSDSTFLPLATPGILKRVPGMLMDPMGPLTIRWAYLLNLAPWLLRFVASATPEKVEAFMRDFGAMIAHARKCYEPIVADAGLADLIRPRGALEVFETKAAFDNIQTSVKMRQRHGVPLNVVGPEEIRQIEPALSGNFAGGIHRTDMDTVINPLKHSQRIAELAAKRGGRFVRGEARRIEAKGGGKSTVHTDGAPLDADLVVVAAGALSKKFAAQAGARVPLDTERGYHAMLPNPGVELRIPVKSAEGGFYMTPMELGLRIAGTDELASVHAPPDYRRVDPMIKRAKRLVPGLNTEGAVPWMGMRPSLPDSKPVVGPAPNTPGVMLAFGHDHYGLTLGAVTGKAIADLVAGRKTDFDVTPFRANRF